MKKVKYKQWDGGNLSEFARFFNGALIAQEFSSSSSDITISYKEQSVFVKLGQWVIQDWNRVLTTAETKNEAELIAELVANGHVFLERKDITKEKE